MASGLDNECAFHSDYIGNERFTRMDYAIFVGIRGIYGILEATEYTFARLKSSQSLYPCQIWAFAGESEHNKVLLLQEKADHTTLGFIGIGVFRKWGTSAWLEQAKDLPEALKATRLAGAFKASRLYDEKGDKLAEVEAGVCFHSDLTLLTELRRSGVLSREQLLQLVSNTFGGRDGDDSHQCRPHPGDLHTVIFDGHDSPTRFGTWMEGLG